MIDAILEWAEDHPEFDTGFVESVEAQLHQHGHLSIAQLNALENIAEKFSIEVE